MRIHGIERIAIVQDNDTVTQLRKVVGNAVTFRTGPLEEDDLTTPKGAPYYGGDESLLEARVLDLDQHAALVALMEAHTEVQLVAAGGSQTIQWLETDPLWVQRDAIQGQLGGRAGYQLRTTRRGHGQHDIQEVTNLFYAFDWLEAGSWTLTAGDFPGASGGGLAGGSAATFHRDILLPLPGMTFSAGITNDDDGGVDLNIIFRNAAGSSLGSVAAEVAGGGRDEITFALPAGTFEVRVEIDIEGDGGNITEPTLRVGRVGRYVAS